MRIITGIAKNTKLNTLEGENTRPTAERTKEAIFSALQFDMDGRTVLDLFAGSGQMGLEALSRGAVSAMFVDASPEAMAVIKDNAKRTNFFSASRFLISDYRSYIRKAGGKDQYSLILLDPPYATNYVEDAILRILDAKLALPGCIFVCEGAKAELLQDKPEILEQFTVLKQAKYGIAHVHILQYKGKD